MTAIRILGWCVTWGYVGFMWFLAFFGGLTHGDPVDTIVPFVASIPGIFVLKMDDNQVYEAIGWIAAVPLLLTIGATGASIIFS